MDRVRLCSSITPATLLCKSLTERSAFVTTRPPYITAKEAALEVGVSYVRMRQLLLAGRVRGAFKLQRDWLVPTPVEILPRQRKEE